jgi:hypothetical protein
VELWGLEQFAVADKEPATAREFPLRREAKDDEVKLNVRLEGYLSIYLTGLLRWPPTRSRGGHLGTL